MIGSKSKIWGKLAACLLASALLLAGCGQKSPKENLASAYEHMLEAKSYNYSGSLKLDLNVPEDLAKDPGQSMAMGLLKNMEITFNGAYQKEPAQTEMTVDLNIKGDMNFGLSVPMVITKDKMFIKIPQTPFFPLPQNVTGKFVVIDQKELSKTSKSPVNVDTLDPAKQQEFAQAALKIIADNYDSDKFMKNVKPSDAKLPSDVKASSAIQFHVDDANVEEAITIALDKALPAMMDLIADPKWANMFNVKKEDMDKAKKELEDSKKDRSKLFEDMKKNVAIHDVTLTTALNSDKYIAYQGVHFDIEAKENGQSGRLGGTIDVKMSDYNKTPNFKLGIPSGSNVITLEDLQKEFGKMGMGGF